jgi:hypothetical protein
MENKMSKKEQKHEKDLTLFSAGIQALDAVVKKMANH